MRRIGPRVWPIGVAFGRPKISVWGHAGGWCTEPDAQSCMFSIRHIAHDPVRIACSPVCTFQSLRAVFQLPSLSRAFGLFLPHVPMFSRFHPSSVFKSVLTILSVILSNHVDHPRADFRREKPYHTHACTDKMRQLSGTTSHL